MRCAVHSIGRGLRPEGFASVHVDEFRLLVPEVRFGKRGDPLRAQWVSGVHENAQEAPSELPRYGLLTGPYRDVQLRLHRHSPLNLNSVKASVAGL